MHATLTAHSEYTVPEKSMHPLPMGVIDVLEGTNIFHVNTRIFNRKFQWVVSKFKESHGKEVLWMSA